MTRLPLPVLALSAVLTLGSLAGAQEIVVDFALDDFVDFGGAQTVADLPGPDGHVSLREAVLAANNTPGPQTIAFHIPTSQWWSVLPGQATIWLDNLLLIEGDDTFLDFSTQTAFTGDTNPNGNEVAMYYGGPPAGIPCLYIAADRCVVRGLDRALGNNVGNGIWITGNENRVVGCTTTGLEIRGFGDGGRSNVIGGTGPGEGNTFSEGVDLVMGASDNAIVGNRFRRGLQIAGDTLYGRCERNRVGGPSAAERNVLAGNGRYGEEGFPIGVQLSVAYSRETRIEGNYVGTTDDGQAKFAGLGGTGGIVVGLGAEDTLVRGNVVSGIVMVGTNHYQGQRFGTGIAVNASAARTTLERNLVGVAADGFTPVPNRQGISVQKDPNGTPAGVLVGGAAPAGNVVAYNETTGVSVGFETPGVRVTGNSIHDNGALGIDLRDASGAGPTPNDVLDADSAGGNHLQNFPRLTRAARAGGTLLAGGVLESEPLKAYAVDVYASATADPSGHGEGARFLGSVAVTTDALGRASFLAAFATAVPSGWVLSATATDVARGETSEFSVVRGVTRVLATR